MTSRRGFTMVEAVVGFTILAIALLPLLKLFLGNVTAVQDTWEGAQAAAVGEELFEKIRAARWQECCAAGTAPAAGPIGLEGIVYDDVDDWNGYSDTSGIYGRTVSVSYMTMTYVTTGGVRRGTMTPAASATETKRVRIVVTDPRGHTTRLDTLLNNVKDQR